MIRSFTLIGPHFQPTLGLGDSSPHKWHWKLNETPLRDLTNKVILAFFYNTAFLFDMEDLSPFHLWQLHKCVIGVTQKETHYFSDTLSFLKFVALEKVPVHKKSLTLQVEPPLQNLGKKMNSLPIDKSKAKLAHCEKAFKSLAAGHVEWWRTLSDDRGTTLHRF